MAHATWYNVYGRILALEVREGRMRMRRSRSRSGLSSEGSGG